MKLHQLFTYCFFVTLLSACGGSGGDTPSVTISENTSIPETGGLGGTSGGTTGETTMGTLVTQEPPEYSTPLGVEVCSTNDIKRRVDFDMRDYYIYYDSVPELNLDDYDTPERLIRDLRVDPDIYSYVTDAEEQSELVESGRSGGFGFRFSPADDGAVRFREILLGSPADDQGLLRGDALLTLNGVPIDDYTNDDLGDVFDPDNAPVSMSVQTGTEEPRDVIIDYADFQWRTVGPVSRFTSSSNPSLPAVGYLPIRIFLETTEAEIDDALVKLADLGPVEELIVDLRYNPGGRTHVTRHIASIVGGEAVANEVFLIRQWNDKYSENDKTDYFDDIAEPMNLPRVVVLVTEYSSSASEVFINALEPYIDVVVVGGVTGGKPFTSNTREYCDKAINAMRSLRTNAEGVSVAGGIQPDCPVEDNWETRASQFGDPLLDGALSYIAGIGCPLGAMTESPTQRSALKQGLSYGAPAVVVPEE